MKDLSSRKELKDCFLQQQSSFTKSPYRSYKQRINDLQALKTLILDNQQLFVNSLSEDFGHRSEDETKIGDILTTISGINYSIKHLKSWMKPKSKHVGLLFQPAKGKVLHQPLGVVGIIAAWNYPLFLSLGPLTAALAAGNNVMIKMSEHTPGTTVLLNNLISKTFTKDKVTIVGGGADIAAEFSQLPFDHLFFTGSTHIGKLVLQAAANNLVPVTLELGGKSPAIIDKSMNIKTAVSRFILGKVINSGQTCVAPDYILCPENKISELVDELKASYSSMFSTLNNNKDSTCIINQQHYSRLTSLIEDGQKKGATIIPLLEEKNDNDNHLMPLTVMTNTTDDMLVMQQEIFGPILPIVSCKDEQDAINYVNERPRPLALYIYSFNKSFQQKILLNTHAGGVCINDAAFHVANDDLPFGGIGPSGMGSYHGCEGFKTFSHAKSVLSRGKINLAPLLFPPYGTIMHKLVYRLFIR